MKIALLFLILNFANAKKVRYKKIGGRQGFENGQNQVFDFLNRITPPRDTIDLFGIAEYDDYYDSPESTTPPSNPARDTLDLFGLGDNGVEGYTQRPYPARDTLDLFGLGDNGVEGNGGYTPSYTTPPSTTPYSVRNTTPRRWIPTTTPRRRIPTTTPRRRIPTTTPRRRVPVTEKPLNDYCIKRRGQNAYPLDCHKFVNCWDSTVLLQSCHPSNLVFNPGNGQCDWGYKPAMKARCEAAEQLKEEIENATEDSEEDSSSEETTNDNETDFTAPNCVDFDKLGYVCVPYYQCVNGIVDTTVLEDSYTTIPLINPRIENGLFTPWLKTCPTRNDICCRDMSKKDKPKPEKPKDLCPSGYSGLQPVPWDCTKFANCWKGKPMIQSCGPGTHFNPINSVCDWPAKANCKVQSLDEGSLVSPDRPDNTIDQEDVDDNNDLDQELWEATINQRRRIGRRKKPVVFPAPTSGQRIRLRGGKSPFEGYVEVEYNDEWGFVCDAGSWTFEEANLVCQELGFHRGMRSTTTGFVHGPVDETRRITDRVDCSGSEESLSECRIKYKSANDGQCNPTKSIVSVTCIHDSIALCDEKEVPWGSSCYSIHFNR